MQQRTARLLRRYVSARGGSMRGYRKVKRWYSTLSQRGRRVTRRSMQQQLALVKEVRGVRAG